MSPQIRGSCWAECVGNGEFAAPPDHQANLDESPRTVGPDEHHHVVVLSDVVNLEPQRVNHVLFWYAVAMGRVENDRLYVHEPRYLSDSCVARLLATAGPLRVVC